MNKQNKKQIANNVGADASVRPFFEGNTQKGITLIALVITIIVLLILAGVTISMVLGDDGIIAQAQQARLKQEEAEEDDKEEIKAGEYGIAKYTEGTVAKELKVGDKVKYTYKYENQAEKEVECVVLYNDDEHGLQIIPTTKVGEITIGSDDAEEVKKIEENFFKMLEEEASKYLNEDLAWKADCIGMNISSEYYESRGTTLQPNFESLKNAIIKEELTKYTSSDYTEVLFWHFQQETMDRGYGDEYLESYYCLYNKSGDVIGIPPVETRNFCPVIYLKPTLNVSDIIIEE